MILCAALLSLSLPALSDPAISETPMGHTLSDFLVAFNSGDPANIDVFKTVHHFGVPTDNIMGIYRADDGLTLLKIEQATDVSVAALVKEKDSDGILRLTIREIGTAEQPKLSLLLQDIPRPPEYAIPRLTQAEALKALKNRAASLAVEDKFSGAYLIAQDGKTLAANAYGWEDRASKVPATTDTKFRMGSINKLFTAVAALQLIDAGKMKLDGKVGDYLPDYPNPEIASKVTIRQLLTNTGGTGDFFGPEFDTNRLKLKTHSDYVALFGARAPLFEPGSKDGYSNYGFLLLGNIIEKVSGLSYYDYVQKRVFAPAGMTHTASAPEDQIVPKRAIAYTRGNVGWVPVPDLPYRGTAAGGGYTTIGDMLKFALALDNGKLLPERLLADATTLHDHGSGTGYGFSAYGAGMLQSYGHNGGAPGINGEFRVYPALHRVVVAFSNYDPNVAVNLANFYTSRMPVAR
ncbi:MAG TPA: serine hydrolase domain-containing protein [Rhizomicrobium sp.]|nr:serine hydrolase domain-containing protein [Rhizomicrobium sp.]